MYLRLSYKVIIIFKFFIIISFDKYYLFSVFRTDFIFSWKSLKGYWRVMRELEGGGANLNWKVEFWCEVAKPWQNMGSSKITPILHQRANPIINSLSNRYKIHKMVTL